MTDRGPGFYEYWSAFVREYEMPTARRFLFMSMSAGIGSAFVGVLARKPLLVALAPVLAFGPPWLVRRIAGAGPLAGASRPVFFAAACIRLWQLTLAGDMDAEVARVVGETPTEADAEADVSPPFPRPNMVTDHTLH